MFEDCEKVNDFSMWLIRIVRPRYTQIVISIEIPIDLKMLMVEKLTGWLKAIEERYELNNDTGAINSKLLFTEDERFVHKNKRKLGEGSSSGEKKSNNGGDNRYCGKQCSRGQGTIAGNYNMTKVKCFNCNIYRY